MAQQIRWSPRAAANFEDICNYIAKDSEHYAALFAKRVIALIKTIPQFPTAGRVVPERKWKGQIFIRYISVGRA